LPLSLPRLMNWGIMQNRNVLTANISESRKIGSECLLSGILEERPAAKYFLSESAITNLIKNGNRRANVLPQRITKEEKERT